MGKPGLEGHSIEPILLDAVARTGWALCIGAGTSVPLFPGWFSLVTRLIAQEVGQPRASELASELLSQFSPDALIQAAYDRFGLSPREFIDLLSQQLYHDLRTWLGDDDWALTSGALSAYRPAHLGLREWRAFLLMACRDFACTTAWSLARVLTRAIGADLTPAAILSFNAEPLLYALATAMLIERDVSPMSAEPSKGEMRQYLDIVNRSVSVRRVGRVPYIFCHGLLPVPGAQLTRRYMPSPDKLVFAEASYLELANLSFSWQSSAFLDVCGFRRTVFVGVSLSDPNMRRWLGWLHSNRTSELRESGGYEGASTYHLWIRKAPSSEDEKRWIESTVAHLGVRLVWVREWTESGNALARMLGLGEKQDGDEANPATRT